MEYILGASAILFFPFFISVMLLVAFWEKDTEGAQRLEKPREQVEQSQLPVREVEKQPGPAPRVMGGGMTEGTGYPTGNQQTAKRHGGEDRRTRKKKRRR